MEMFFHRELFEIFPKREPGINAMTHQGNEQTKNGNPKQINASHDDFNLHRLSSDEVFSEEREKEKESKKEKKKREKERKRERKRERESLGQGCGRE